MKRLFAFACSFVFSQALCAATPIDGWYTTGFGGISKIDNNIQRPWLAPTYTSAHIQTGYNAGGRFGYKSGPMRYEGEVYYIHGSVDNFSIAYIMQTGVTGYSHAIPVMANVYFDWDDTGNDLAPFLGAGIGYAHIVTKLASTGPLGYTAFKGSDNKFAYQGTAGINYYFAENYSAGISYRYFSTDKSNQLGKRFASHLGLFSVTYRFEEDRYK